MKPTMNAKKLAAAVCTAVLACCLAGCAGGAVTEPAAEEPAAPRPAAPESAEPPVESPAPAQSPTKEDEPMQARTIEVGANGTTVAFELNESAAAAALLAQLPLSVAVEDFSTNEKIFYPPESLDVADAPHAEGGAGTLAYFAPWGNVVMFYGDYSPNDGLYEMGRVVFGADAIGDLTGTVEVSAA